LGVGVGLLGGCGAKVTTLHRFQMSTGERPFLDLLQDRRYWVIDLVTIPSLFLAGVIFVSTGFVWKLFLGQRKYFSKDNREISMLNDRFSSLNEIEDFC
jgi:photosystem II cytochrome b559 subunit alpha